MASPQGAPQQRSDKWKRSPRGTPQKLGRRGVSLSPLRKQEPGGRLRRENRKGCSQGPRESASFCRARAPSHTCSAPARPGPPGHHAPQRPAARQHCLFSRPAAHGDSPELGRPLKDASRRPRSSPWPLARAGQPGSPATPHRADPTDRHLLQHSATHGLRAREFCHVYLFFFF